MPHTCPHLPGSTWHALASGDQRAWDNVTDSSKATIIEDSLHASPSPSQPPKPSPSGSIPPSGMSHHVRFHDTWLADDLVAFEAFRAGRSSATTEIHQMLQEAVNADNSAELEEPPDSPHAHVTKHQQNMVQQMTR